MTVRWRAVRSVQNPIIRPGMPGLTSQEAANINGPSLIRGPEWLPDPLGRYYLYFAHHGGTYIRLAYADAPAGPWRIHAPGTLRLEQTAAARHIASPDVHVHHERREIRMYFHGGNPQGGRQISFVATSRDGLHFDACPTVLGWFYFRVFRHDGWHYAVAKYANDNGILQRSRDGLSPFEEGPQILPRMRHAAVLLEGNCLHVFYSRIGDDPESILVSEIPLAGDWGGWRASEPRLVLRPETEYEGGHLPSEPSRPGAARGAVRQLRDPCTFVQDGRCYLLYSVAGEQGIALAELMRP